jgi:ABC-type transport system substrate-binding protein
MILDLKEKNFKLVEGPGMFMSILFSDMDQNSPLSNIKVRQAIICALDRETIANTLGQGLYEPLTQMAHKTSPGYNAGYDPYPYDTDRAKQLLSEAGYPNGFTIKILGSSGSATNDAMALFQYDLSLVGITVEPDIADLAATSVRYSTATGRLDGLLHRFRHQPGRLGPVRPFRSEPHDLPHPEHLQVPGIR